MLINQVLVDSILRTNYLTLLLIGLKLILFQIKDILQRDAVENMSGKLNLSHSCHEHGEHSQEVR